jgi:outer membrane protein OmpA-like peptidoglycan-associated protein
MFNNWQRGLVIAGYSSSEEVNASTLPARRTATVLRVLTDTCHVDASRLFAVQVPPVPDPQPPSYRRRVELEVLRRTDLEASKWQACHHGLGGGIGYGAGHGIVTKPMPTIRFDKGSNVLNQEAVKQLGEVCADIKEHDSVLEIVGLSAAGEPDGEHLSQRRADAVQRQLVSCGVDPERMRTKGQAAAPPSGSAAGAQVELNLFP